MGALWRDIRFGIRTLARAPGFTVVVVVTLALGIGANTAIFSVVDAVLLERMPYDEPDGLVTAWQDQTRRDGPVREWFSYTSYLDLKEEPGLMEAVGIWGGWNPTLTGVGDPLVITAATVNEGMFSRVLRVRPSVGRTFLPSDDVEGAPGVVILSHRAWQDRFGGAEDIVGRSVNLAEVPYTVVGVMPDGFRPPFVQDAELWRSLSQSGAFQCTRGCFGWRVVARLAPGVTLPQARAHATALAARLEETYPESNTNQGIALFGLREDITRNASRALWVLLGAVGFVLLIACTNVANLLLARGTAREAELGVRVALGAGRGPILRQLLTESLLLAAAGGLAGLAIAAWGTDALLALAPDGSVPRLEGVGMDGPILAFTAAVTVATGFVFGLVPAWRAGSRQVFSSIRAAGRGGAPGTRLQAGLAVTQIGLALVLLVGAGLLMRSFQRLHGADLGFEPEGVLTAQINLPTERYDESPERQAFYFSLLDRVRALPGVESAGAVDALPLAGNDGDADFLVEGEPAPEPGVSQAAWIRPVTEGYFDAIGLEVVRGRDFTASDDAAAPRVVMINETLAERYYPGREAVGQRIAFGSDPATANWRTIVGVAADVRHFGIRDGTRPSVYFPYRQVSFPSMSVAIKASGDLSALAPAVRAAVTQEDPALAASQIRPLQDFVDRALAPDRFLLALLGIFSLLALVIAAVGVYGVISYGVTRRMREMGIRLALGAETAQVRAMVVRRGLVISVWGVAAGLAGAWFLTRVLQSLLYGVDARDPLAFLGTTAVLTVVALLASWLPARRAARADVVSVLREE